MKENFLTRLTSRRSVVVPEVQRDMDDGQLLELQETIQSFFNVLANLEGAGVRSPELLYQQITNYLDRLPRQAERAGLNRDGADDVRYALVAFADETCIRSAGPLRDYWMSHLLQLRIYNENVAGEVFFDRLERLMRGTPHPVVLAAYYTCLMFGFRGKYAVPGGELTLSELGERMRDQLFRLGWLATETQLSPDGARPNESAVERGRNMLVFSIAVCAAIAALLLYFGLRLSLLVHAEELADRITSVVGG